MNKDTEQRLLDALGTLPREREPGSDLWPGIEVRLNAPQVQVPPARTARRQPAMIAAGLLVAVLAGYLVGSRQPPGDADEMLADDTVYGNGGNHLAALFQEMDGALKEVYGSSLLSGPDWMPATTSIEVEDGFSELKDLAKVLRDALRQDPGNADLARWLVRVEARQMSLLKEMNQLEFQSWREL